VCFVDVLVVIAFATACAATKLSVVTDAKSMVVLMLFLLFSCHNDGSIIYMM